MFTLKKFELQICNTIVHRGKEYYENDAVLDLEETGKGFWHAEVMEPNHIPWKSSFLEKTK